MEADKRTFPIKLLEQEIEMTQKRLAHLNLRMRDAAIEIPECDAHLAELQAALEILRRENATTQS